MFGPLDEDGLFILKQGLQALAGINLWHRLTHTPLQGAGGASEPGCLFVNSLLSCKKPLVI
jgi:hypothetical protein